MKKYLLAALIMLLTACLSPSGDAPQIVEPTPTASLVLTTTHTPSPEPTSTPTITPSPTPEPLTIDDLEGMSDGEKLSLVPNPKDYQMQTSDYITEIVIILGEDGPYAYNLLSGNETSLSAVNLELIPTIDDGFIEARSFTERELSKGFEMITKDKPVSRPLGNEFFYQNPEFTKVYLETRRRVKTVFMEGPRGRNTGGAFQVDARAFGGEDGYFYPIAYAYLPDSRIIANYIVSVDDGYKVRFAVFVATQDDFINRGATKR